MIRLSKIKTLEEFYLNAELVETIEETPDTVITLVNGKKMIVDPSADEVVRRIMDYRRSLTRNYR